MSDGMKHTRRLKVVKTHDAYPLRTVAAMTATWVTIGLLTVGTVAIKAVGPVVLGGRDLPPRLNGVVARLAPALLAAAAALAARLPMVAVVLIAAAVTAVLRAL